MSSLSSLLSRLTAMQSCILVALNQWKQSGTIVICSRVDFHHFDSAAVPNDASPETLSGKVVQIQEKLALFLALGSAFYVGVTMRPRWRMHDIRDAWDQTTEERYTQSQEVDPTRSHFPAHWRSMSVLCYGACASILGLEKALVGACRFFWIN